MARLGHEHMAVDSKSSSALAVDDFIINYTEIFVEKMREAFAMQKLHTFFQQKISAYSRY